METSELLVLEDPVRNFLPADLQIEAWEDIKPYCENLLNRELSDLDALRSWLRDSSELEAVLEENGAWRYIKMSIDNLDESLVKRYTFFIENIQPELARFGNEFNKKLVACPFIDQLEGKEYEILVRGIRKQIEIFREENVPVQAEAQKKSQEFGAISGAMTVEIDGESLTMQAAGALLHRTDRALREDVYRKMQTRRLADSERLDQLFSELVGLRHQIAANSGFENYRDYKFADLGRFDYSVQDCYDFHDSVAKAILPLIDRIHAQRKEELAVDQYRPWDTEVNSKGLEALKPFDGVEELIQKSIAVFNHLDPYFGECLRVMDEQGYLDLASKKGKSPGGYNYPLYEVGIPFIFMNAVGVHRDMVTMMHEGGHAVHSFLTRDLELTGFKSFPSEVAELASMTMELISMDYWHHFFADEEELKRAKREQLESVLMVLPWVATIDKFQHWIYMNPEHTVVDRRAEWLKIHAELGTSVIDWTGLDEERAHAWHKQMHLFELPFYYIEYGFAQLGAISLWKNYKQNPQAALQQYKEALSLGYTRTIPEIYATAGIKFDFSASYVEELAGFVQAELDKL